MEDGWYKIKTWEEMKKEFGNTRGGNIDCEGTFTIDMEKEMPRNRIIKVENNSWSKYNISSDMIKCKVEGNKTMCNEILKKYEFKGDFDLNLIVNDMVRDGQRSFIVSGQTNALVGIMQNSFSEFENICWNVEEVDGDFKCCEHSEFDIIDPYFYIIIDKYEVAEWISILKEERKLYNKTILKEKDKIEKLRKQNKLTNNRFKVFSIPN